MESPSLFKREDLWKGFWLCLPLHVFSPLCSNARAILRKCFTWVGECAVKQKTSPCSYGYCPDLEAGSVLNNCLFKYVYVLGTLKRHGQIYPHP